MPKEKLDAAYVELDHALRREQRAQQLLKEQGEQLQELGSRVDLHTSADIQNQASLTDAVQVGGNLSRVDGCWGGGGAMCKVD